MDIWHYSFSARFEAVIDAAPVASIVWQLGSQDVHQSLQRGQYEIQADDDLGVYTLTLHNCVPKMAGPVRCLAKNRHGHAEHQAHLNVLHDGRGLERETDGKRPLSTVAPQFVSTLRDSEVLLGGAIEFECRLAAEVDLADPELTVRWLKDDVELIDGVHFRHLADGHRLRLCGDDARLRDSGSISCHVSNAAGRAKCSAELRISSAADVLGDATGERKAPPIGPPRAPPNAPAVDRDDGERVELSWTPSWTPSTADAPLSYIVEASFVKVGCDVRCFSLRAGGGGDSSITTLQ